MEGKLVTSTLNTSPDSKVSGLGASDRHDLHISDKANINERSYSSVGNTYRSPNPSANSVSLTGSRYFKLVEYEVYHILGPDETFVSTHVEEEIISKGVWTVSVAIEKEIENSPQLFLIRLTTSRHGYFDSLHRFSYVREIAYGVDDVNAYFDLDILFKREFPRQYKRNVIGIKLGPEELEERRSKLELVYNY